MCLTRVNDDKPKPKGFGYKVVFLTRNKKLLPLYYACKSNLAFGKWVNASNERIDTGNGDSYPSGFHIFTNSKLAKKNRTEEKNYFEPMDDGNKVVLIKVQYDDAKVSGSQHEQPVIVAGRMKPIKIVK